MIPRKFWCFLTTAALLFAAPTAATAEDVDLGSANLANVLTHSKAVLKNSSGTALKALNLTGNAALLSLSLTNTKGFLLPEGFVTLTGLVSFDMKARADLTSIDVSHFKKLVALTLDNDALTSLDVSKNMELETLSLFDNEVSVLDLSRHKNLKSVNVRLNRLTKIDLTHNSALYDAPNSNVQLSPQARPMDPPAPKVSTS